MNRYLVIDLEKNEIIDINEIMFSEDEETIKYSGSVSCTSKSDLIEELENLITGMKYQYNYSGDTSDKKVFKEIGYDKNKECFEVGSNEYEI